MLASSAAALWKCSSVIFIVDVEELVCTVKVFTVELSAPER